MSRYVYTGVNNVKIYRVKSGIASTATNMSTHSAGY